MRMWWPAVVKSAWELRTLRLDYGRSLHAYVNKRLQIQLELLMMSGVPLETCWAFNERWNDKFWYKVASCWLFLLRFYPVPVMPCSPSPYETAVEWWVVRAVVKHAPLFWLHICLYPGNWIKILRQLFVSADTSDTRVMSTLPTSYFTILSST